MHIEVVRRLKPEEEELLRKREELLTVRIALAERELELVDLRGQLAAFEGRYLRLVGALYAELDEWSARICELRAQLVSSAAATDRARVAREKARNTFADAHSEDSEVREFVPSAKLKVLFREVARRIHPDFCKDKDDLERRTRLMADANRAYEAGDANALQRILDEYQDGAETVEGEGIGAELVRIIRQISQARERMSAIERELAALKQSDIALLREQTEEAAHYGRDLLSDLADSVRDQIQQARAEYNAVAKEGVKQA